MRVTEQDCGTCSSISIGDLAAVDGVLIESLERRLCGRTASDIMDVAGKRLIPLHSPITSPMAATIAASRDALKVFCVRSVLYCESENGVCAMCYGAKEGANAVVEVGENVGVLAAKTIAHGVLSIAAGVVSPRYRTPRFHIGATTPGYSGPKVDLPAPMLRLLQLFEAHKPQHSKVLAPMDGILRFGKESNDGVLAEITDDKGQSCSITVPATEPPLSYLNGCKVNVGEAINDGIDFDPNDILYCLGERHCQDYLLREFQELLTFFCAIVPDRDLELVLRFMSCWREIVDKGETRFIEGEIVHSSVLRHVDECAIKAGRRPATAHLRIIGISRAIRLLENLGPLDQISGSEQMSA